MNSIFSKKIRTEDANDNRSSLADTKWNCKYHIVFSQKYRKKFFMG